MVKFPCTRKVRQTGQFIGTCENLITFRNKCLKCKGGEVVETQRQHCNWCYVPISCHILSLSSDFQDFFGNLWMPWPLKILAIWGLYYKVVCWMFEIRCSGHQNDSSNKTKNYRNPHIEGKYCQDCHSVEVYKYFCCTVNKAIVFVFIKWKELHISPFQLINYSLSELGDVRFSWFIELGCVRIYCAVAIWWDCCKRGES